MTRCSAFLAVLVAGSVLGWATGIAVSPALVELVLPPGSVYADYIKVTNLTRVAVQINARAMGFTAPLGLPQLIDPTIDTYPYSGREVLKLEPESAVLGPEETKLFKFTLSMPVELSPYGGRYVAAVFTAVPVEAPMVQVLTAPRVATLFLVSPGLDVAPQLKFQDISIRQDSANPRKVVLEATVVNDGNVHISADQIIGWIVVTDSDGYIIDHFKVWTHTMLPDNTYRHVEEWMAPDTLPSGTYLFHLILTIFTPLGTPPQHYNLTLPAELRF